MDAQTIAAIVAASFTGVSLLGGVAILIYRTGHATADSAAARTAITTKLEDISKDVKRINGSIADVTKTANRNAQRLARIEGEHQHLKQ